MNITYIALLQRTVRTNYISNGKLLGRYHFFIGEYYRFRIA